VKLTLTLITSGITRQEDNQGNKKNKMHRQKLKNNKYKIADLKQSYPLECSIKTD